MNTLAKLVPLVIVRTLVTLALVLVGTMTLTAYAQDQCATKGGILEVAMKSEPPMLDMHITTTNTVRNVAMHINEGLFTFDENFVPVPHLATGYQRSNDGLVYTINLREGVPFHNGEEMTSEDVVAALQRWMDRSSFGQTLAQYTEAIEAKDKYTVELRLNTPVNLVITSLATFRAGPVIYPAEVIEETGTGQITEFIGTGPYRFVEWIQGQEIVLERFEDYQSVDRSASGYAGRREACLDRLRFVFIPELSVRKIGIETGDFDVALDVDPDSYGNYKDDPEVQSFLGAPRMTTLIPNKKEGLMANLTLRRAVQAAVCVEDILPVYGNERFWRVDPSLTWQETAWWSEAGAELYNICNPQLAQQLLEEAGYDGTPLRFAVDSADASKYNVALIVEQQLEQVGFSVDLEVRDAAAHGAVLDDPGMWDLNVSEHTYRSHPILHSHLQADWTGWWENEVKEELIDDFVTADSQEEALGVWDEIHQLYYEDAAIIKIGDYFEHHIARDEVKGYANMPEPFFWNVWLSEEND